MAKLTRELVVDSFAGGGGASTGIEMATGRSPDFAINHDPIAMAMHAINHPDTIHLPHNVWKVDPSEICGGRPVGLLWASPDCKDFSKAKGGQPVRKNIRDLAWVVVRWAKQVRPRIIFLENVEEFQDWGPVLEGGVRCPERKGLHFRRFVRELQREGYRVEWRELRGCDYGSPTRRKRLFLIARRDGLPIIWPKPSHAKAGTPEVLSGKLRAWNVAAGIIDWDLPCPSVFLSRKEGRAAGVNRPLAPATMARIAKGVKRYVLDAERPFVVPLTHHDKERGQSVDEPLATVTGAHRGEQALVTPFFAPRYNAKAGHEPRTAPVTEPAKTIVGGGNAPGMLVTPVLVTNSHQAIVTPFITKFRQNSIGTSMEEPLHTVTANGHTEQGREGCGATHAVVAPVLINTRNGERQGQAPRALDVQGLYPTVTAQGSQGALAVAFLAQHNTGEVGHTPESPISTIVGKGCTQAIVSAGLINMHGADSRMSTVDEPAPTQTAGGTHQADARAFLMRYFGTEQDPRLDEPLATSTTKGRDGVAQVEVAAPPLTPEQMTRARAVADLLRSHGFWDDRELVTLGDWIIVDIGMRMLTPRELFRAQGFPGEYTIARGRAVVDDPDGRWKAGDIFPITKTAQIRCCGNSVNPQVAEALVRANYAEMEVTDAGVPEFALSAAE